MVRREEEEEGDGDGKGKRGMMGREKMDSSAGYGFVFMLGVCIC